MDEFIGKKIVLDLMRNIGILSASDQYMFEVISHYPAADVAPVVHGKWVREVYTDPQGGKWTKYRCSLCGRIEIKEEPYCNCGAKNG